MKDDLKEYAAQLGKDRPDVQDILRRSELFPHDIDRFTRLLKNQWLKEGGDVLNRPVFPKFRGQYPPNPESYLTHKLTDSATGTGKTVSAIIEASALIEAGTNAIIFGYLNQFTHLGLMYPENVQVAWLDMLKINLLEKSEGESAEEVGGWLGTNIWENFYVRDMGGNIAFEETLNAITKYPNATIYHLIRGLEERLGRTNLKDRSNGSIVTVLNRLRRPVTELPHTFACSKGFPIEFFVSERTCVIIPLFGVPIYTANFIVNHIIRSILRNKKRLGSFITVFIIDEAQNYINKQRESRMDLGEPYAYTALRQSRNVNAGFLLLSQTMGFSSAILGNLNSVAIGKLLNGS